MLHERADEDLMMLVAQGHKAAFDQLVRRHFAKACAIASRIGGNANDAEDIAQDALLKVWLNAPSWKGGQAKFSTWFYRIVMNASIDRYRARKPSSSVDWDSFEDAAPGAEAECLDKQERAIILKAVNRLPEKQRTAILLCYQKEMTNTQASQIMGLHIKSLEALLARARKTLKEELKNLRETAL